ncbi:MAG: polyprenol phosphomannose-dependent alpha 1,6 mannosyltransferase MptB [Nocardiaceae bacterium]|nr:polyprenol phosphomannose-dependent alpha 1,6 mannosyltransferase MptB [Nocardiaceae bacterium]
MTVTEASPVDRLVSLGRRILGLDVTGPDHTVAALHGLEAEAKGLLPLEVKQLRRIRLFGATGAVLMAIGALGAGAQPVLQNPVAGLRFLGLPARMLTTALTTTITGTVMVVLAWLLLGRFALGIRTGRRMTRSQLDRTLLLWILPLSVGPPMFSRDVYSYLAQSEIAARGLDPYAIGPGPALGLDNVLSRTVPTIWRDTPAPYGPLFLWMGERISSITGYNIVPGILLHRALALIGLAMIVWALPRLARRCGVAPVAALWLGAANPLVLFHLVAGVHNEALMIGFMMAGFEIALRGLDAAHPLRGKPLLLLVTGTVLMSASTMIKITSLIALGFLGMALARKIGRGFLGVVISAAILLAICAIVIAAISVGTGLGMGWVSTLNTASAVRSWMSLPTAIGVITGFGGVLLGLGDHTTAVLGLTRPIAATVAAFVVMRMLVATYTGRLHPVGALGVSFGAMVLLFPVVQPWYLLWGVIPLAAWATTPAFRVPTVVFSTIVAVILMPNGAEFKPFVIVEAAIAAICVIGVIIISTVNRLPWSSHAIPEAQVSEPEDEQDTQTARQH